MDTGRLTVVFGKGASLPVYKRLGTMESTD